MTQNARSTGGRPYLMLAIILLALVISLLAVLVLATPRIVSTIVSSRITGVATSELDGGTSSVKLSVGWTSPFEIEELKVTSKDGRTLADLSLTTQLSLLDVIRFDGDVGTVTLKGGELVVTPALRRALTEGGAPSTKSSGAIGTTTTDELSLAFLRNVTGRIEVESLKLTIEDEAGTIVSSDDLTASLGLDRGSFDASLTSSEPMIDFSSKASGFIGADGGLVFRDGTADASLTASVPRETVERVLGAFGMRTEDGYAVTVERTPLRAEKAEVRLSASLGKGRLSVTSDGPSSVPMFDALLARLVPEGVEGARVQARPSVGLELNEFAVDLLPEGGGIADLSTGVIDAKASVSRVIVSTPEGNGGSRTTEISPMSITLRSGDLSGKVEASATTRLSIDGKRTGEFVTSMRVDGPLTNDLVFNRESIGTLSALARVDDVPGELFEPLRRFLEPIYPEGPPTTRELFGDEVASIDFAITPDRQSGLENATISASMESVHLLARLDLERRGHLIVSRDGTPGLKIDTANLRPLVAPLLGEGVSIEKRGSGAISIDQLSIALDDAFRPDLSRSSGRVRVLAGRVDVNMDGGRLASVESLDSILEFSPDSPAELTLDYRFDRDGEVFDLYQRATIDLPPFPKDIAEIGTYDLSRARASVMARLTDAPIDVLEMFDPEIAQTARELGGETVTMTVRPGAASEGESVHTLNIETDTGRFAGGSTIRVKDGLLRVTDSSYSGTLTPDVFGSIHDRHASMALGESAFLETDAPYTLTAGDLVMDLRNGLVPDVSTLRNFSAGIEFDADVVLRNVERPDEDGGGASTIDVGLAKGMYARYLHDANDDLDREVNGRVSLFDPNAEGRPMLAKLKARSGLTGVANVEINVEESDTSSIDAWLGLGGQLAEAFGPSVRGRAQIIDQKRPEGRSYYVSLVSERARLLADLLETDEQVGLRQPISLTWDPTPAFLASRVSVEDGTEGEQRLRILESSPVTIAVDKLRLGPSGARFEPGNVEIGAKAQMSRFSFAFDDGPPVSFRTIQATMEPTESLDAIDFAFAATRVDETGEERADGSSAGSGGALSADGRATFREDGSAAVTMVASGDFPTLAVDAFANTGGAVYDLLGPTTTVDLRTSELSHSSGSALINVLSDHTQGSVRGEVRDDVFHADDGARITITRISEDFSERYIETILPVLTRFEKTKEDDEATFVANGLTVPLGAGVEKLNGTIEVDLGTVQFKTSRLIGDILEATKNKAEGSLGGRIKPFTVSIAKGVISYPRTPIPTGKYVMETRGTVDLVKNRMDIIVYLPISALSGDIREAFRQVQGLDLIGMAPIRIKGKLDSPSVEPALDLLVTEGVPQTIERVLDGLFRRGVKELDEELGGEKKSTKTDRPEDPDDG